MAAIILVAPLLLHVALGGFISSSGIVVMAFIAPVVVLVFEGVERALPWLAAFVGVVVLSLLLPLQGGSKLPQGVVIAMFAVTLVTVAVLIFLVLAIFATQREQALALVADERDRADELVEAVLPVPIADRLKLGERRIAEHYDAATVVFADVVGFTPLTARLDADSLVELLDRLFRRFDAVVDRHGIEKIKTIGDSYMVASGAPMPRPDHAVVAARFALDLLDTMAAFADDADVSGAALQIDAGPGSASGPNAADVTTGHGPDGSVGSVYSMSLRIGMHSGPVVGGVLGRRRPIYDLWGDTVNVASRMESQGIPGRIQVSDATRALLSSEFALEERGTIDLRGRGPMRTWFLVGRRDG